MPPILIISISIGYVALLFLIAWIADKREAAGRSIVKNSAIYALSMAVYCTAWTFYGSVGRAATTGLGFLPTYLGPALLAPVWWLLLKKIIIISKSQRITSIADFISSRYGKSTFLGVIATLISVFGIIPYISIQLKAISSSFDLLIGQLPAPHADVPFYLDTALYITVALASFTILFGTRNLDPNERHGGLVAAIAFESLLKLVAFISIGLFVTFGLYDGFGDIFQKGQEVPSIRALFTLESAGLDGWEWFWLLFLSMSAVMLLPRQFHVAVVENTNTGQVARASWMFPLYLLLINIFVLPIAIAGLLMFPEGGVEPDSYVLSIPLATGNEVLALFVALGGFSAATSMVIVAVIALSIMIVNNLVLPGIVRNQEFRADDQHSISTSLLGIRRISIILVLLLAYAYFKAVGENYSLVSVGLISFTAIAQFVPVVLGGVYWKRATKAGAIWGLSIGFIIWGFCLPFPTLVETNLVNDRVMQEGLFGWELLKPYALFGLSGYSPVANAAFWSLLLNTFTYIVVSLNTPQSPLEISQADLFVDIYKYRSGGNEYEVMRRQAKVQDLRILLTRFLGPVRAQTLLAAYEARNKIDLTQQKIAAANLINYVETHLAGAIGAASAKIIIGSIAKEDPISLEEMFKVLEQTKEIVEYSKALEKKSAELERTTFQLQQANEQLKELDRLKADFITTVTHELRTPITSIKALSKIMLDNKEMPASQQAEFLSIVVTESERLTRLINQVLDLEKIQSHPEDIRFEALALDEVARQAFNGLKQLMRDKQITPELVIEDAPVKVYGHFDRLTQVIVNLLSNAIKFADDDHGLVRLRCYPGINRAYIEVTDNGPGISQKDQKLIFEKFTQISDKEKGKPQGSGLGLFITHTFVQQHQGRLSVESNPGEGATFKVTLPLWD
ncbi:MAG: histidine kinase, partial [Mameliella sp.]|nr:histidine kinase [Phaeodactylibacter sp.]